MLNGVWEWKKTRVVLEWWTPTSGCWPADINRDWVWVRILGLPLNLWTQKILKQIEDQCDGFIEIEKETMLRNHLQWTRIKVKGDGKLVLTEIKVTRDGLVYNSNMGEAPVTIRADREKKEGLGRGLRII